MTAEIRLKDSKLSSRADILEKIRQDECIISVHEHIDSEELYFNNGKSIYYGQDLVEFQSSVPRNCVNVDSFTPKFFAAVFFACPSYERFRAINLSNEVRHTTDIYYDINNRVFEEIGVLQKIFMDSAHVSIDGKLPVLPLPFLFVDPNQPASLFEKRYAAVFNNVVGLKWHPYAQNKPPIDYVKAGYIDLAADYGLPTVIHSERPGERGDLAALFRDVSPAAEAKKTNVDFAHMGFLHPDFSPLEDFEHSFIDMAPWSSICLGENPGLSIDGRADMMAKFLRQYGKKLLFGLDTPYHWSLWSNGNTFGAEVSEEFEIVNKAVKIIGAEAGKNFLCRNSKIFLGIK